MKINNGPVVISLLKVAWLEISSERRKPHLRRNAQHRPASFSVVLVRYSGVGMIQVWQAEDTLR
jgi:hypothetical protein